MSPPGLLDRQLLSVLAGAAGAFLGFNLLLAVVPVIAERESGEVGAGLATGVFMLTTVVGQLLVNSLIRAIQPAALFIVGLVLIGVPALLYAVSEGLVSILTITAARGLGFGFCTVLATLLIVAHVPTDMRGRALGLFGLVSSLSTVCAPPLGLWLLDNRGSTVYVLTAVATVALCPPMLLIRQAQPIQDQTSTNSSRLLSRAAILTPLVVLVSGTLLFGGMYTFIPTVAEDHVEMALVVFGFTMAVTRTISGRAGDRVRPEYLLLASTACAAAGSSMIWLQPSGWELLAGAALAGSGVGAMMTASLMVVLERAATDELAGASTLWNVGVDAGLALGGFGLALVVGVGGTSSVFLATSLVLVCAIGLATVDARSGLRLAPTDN